MAAGKLALRLGVKTDPVQYRYSYEWLFRLMAEEGVSHAQLGSFFELYQLPDEYFQHLRRTAGTFGITISSTFTAHRELGGFFRDDGPGWEQVARRSFQRQIEVGAILGARSVGSNPGAVLRDRMAAKPEGIRRYLKNMKELMQYAHQRGVAWLGVEPMSCLAEPPTLPDEIRAMMDELSAFHTQRPADTCRVGSCTDVSHGYADADGKVIWDNLQLFQAALPYTHEIHLKNTDAMFNSTFGFSPAEVEKGIAKVDQIRDLLVQNAAKLPVQELIGYFEIGGPKLGRDYTDHKLERAIRESLRYLKASFEVDLEKRGLESFTGIQSSEVLDRGSRIADCRSHTAAPGAPAPTADCQLPTANCPPRTVLVSPSLMCADLCHLEDDVRRLETAGMDMLHFDLMDSHFVPNMPMGLVTIQQLRPRTKLPFDVHLMVENNELFVRELAKMGVQQVSVHAESARHLDRVLVLIRELGMKAGVALNPATPLAALDYVVEHLDFVLLMTVNPGFAGQKLVPAAMRKIADCRAYLDEHGCRHVPIEVDGNVSFANIPRMVTAGAGILVAGSSSIYYRDASLADNVANVRRAVAEGLAMRNGGEQTGTPAPTNGWRWGAAVPK